MLLHAAFLRRNAHQYALQHRHRLGPLAGGGSELQYIGAKIMIDYFAKKGGWMGYGMHPLEAVNPLWLPRPLPESPSAARCASTST